MDQEEQQARQAGCELNTIHIPDGNNAGNIEVVQLADGSYRILGPNAQQFGGNCHPVFQQVQTVVKHQPVVYETQLQHQIMHQQAPNIIFQDSQYAQMSQSNVSPRIVLANSSPQKIMNQQIVKFNPSTKYLFITQPQQMTNILETARSSPPKPEKRIITLDGHITSPVVNQNVLSHMASPQKTQNSQALFSAPTTPPKFQIHQYTPQTSPVGRNMQVKPLASPGQSPRVQVGVASSPNIQEASPKPNAAITQNLNLSANAPVITTGNKSFSLISATSCKAVPISAVADENELETAQEQIQPQSIEDIIPIQQYYGSPQVPPMLKKPVVTPPPRTSFSLPSTPKVSVGDPPPAEAEPAKLVPGKLAVCKICGYMSVDFNRCQRCKRKFPEDVKARDDPGCKVTILKPVPATQGSGVKVISKASIPLPSSSVNRQKPVDQRPTNRVGPILLRTKKLPAQGTVRRSKAFEEPVCLTISDDEDDPAAPKDKPPPPPPPAVPSPVVKLIPKSLEISPLIKSKEPSVNEIQQAEEVDALTLGLDIEKLSRYQAGAMGCIVSNIKCRTVRVGSYKVEPLEPVLICPEGVRICLPKYGSTDAVVLEIPRCNIICVLAHLGRAMPVFFLYLKKATCAKIRDVLNFKDPSNEPYFDSMSSKETQKRITLLPERVSDEAKLTIKRIFSKEFGKDILTTLEGKEANAILVRASPITAKDPLPPQRNATRSQDSPKVAKKEAAKELIVYPKPPLKGGIPITTDDYLCLGVEQFLNDVIIDFYLKYLVHKLSEQDQARTHIFSSFFYRRLTTRQLTRKSEVPAEKLTPAEQRHARVKSWTKNVDVFEKDFVFIPINEHAHWFLAVICFPGLQGLIRMSDGQPITAEKLKLQRQATAKASNKKVVVCPPVSPVKQFTIGATTVTITHPNPKVVSLLKEKGAKAVISLEDDEGSDRDEAEGDEEEFKLSGDEVETDPLDTKNLDPLDTKNPDPLDTKNPGPLDTKNPDPLDITNADPLQMPAPDPLEVTQPDPLKDMQPEPLETAEPEEKAEKSTPAIDTTCHPDAIKQPCILIFDSLPNNQRSRVVATLRDYLKIEYKAKKGVERDFNKDSIRGALPKVPMQNNFTDCGLYMLQYAESFFTNPIKDFHLPLKNLHQWFEETKVANKREDIAKLIQQLMVEEKVDVKLPSMVFSPLPPENVKVVKVTPLTLTKVEPETKVEVQAATSTTEEAGEEMQMEESSGSEMVSLAVVVPEEHILPDIKNDQESEIVVSEEQAEVPAPSAQDRKAAVGLNDSAESVDPENMNQCIEMLDNLFPDDDERQSSECDKSVQSPVLKRVAEPSTEEISPKRVC